jgi:hypothetical protein
MKAIFAWSLSVGVVVGLTIAIVGIAGQGPAATESQPAVKPGRFDAVQDAQTPHQVKETRPEQQKNQHDTSDMFGEESALPSSPALNDQVGKGKMDGFDFARDPLGSNKPKMTLAEIMKADIDAKPKVMAQQRKLLEARYDLTPKLDPQAKMTRGKPLCVGPTARLPG